MKKILILGASVLQLPAIQRAKERGMWVSVVDFNPEAIGIEFADEYFNVSTINIDGIVDVARKVKPDGIMTLATDMPMRAVAAACAELNLTGISFETAIKSTDKGEMIKAFESNNVEHPWFYIVDNEKAFEEIIKNIEYPCIIKPTDSSGSRGVILVDNQSEIEDAYRYSIKHSSSSKVIIEEYMVGKEVSVEIIVYKGEITVLQVTDKMTTGAPHFVEMGHCQPSRICKEDLEKIKDLACRAVRAVGIQNGPAHVEIMLTSSGPKMVELGARMGGDCITTHLVPLSTGINMIDAVIDISCGEAPCLTPKFSKGAAIGFIDCPCGVIKNISGVSAAENSEGVVQVCFTKKIGDQVGVVGCSTDRVGYIITQSDDVESAAVLNKKALENIKVITE